MSAAHDDRPRARRVHDEIADHGGRSYVLDGASTIPRGSVEVTRIPGFAAPPGIWGPSPYSERRAVDGGILDARRAGTVVATRTTTASNAVTPTMVSGS